MDKEEVVETPAQEVEDNVAPQVEAPEDINEQLKLVLDELEQLRKENAELLKAKDEAKASEISQLERLKEVILGRQQVDINNVDVKTSSSTAIKVPKPASDMNEYFAKLTGNIYSNNKE